MTPRGMAVTPQNRLGGFYFFLRLVHPTENLAAVTGQSLPASFLTHAVIGQPDFGHFLANWSRCAPFLCHLMLIGLVAPVFLMEILLSLNSI